MLHKYGAAWSTNARAQELDFRSGARVQNDEPPLINDQWRSNLFVEISNFHAYIDKIVVICRFDINQRASKCDLRWRVSVPAKLYAACIDGDTCEVRAVFSSRPGGLLAIAQGQAPSCVRNLGTQHGLGASSSPVPLPVCVERAKKSK